MREAFFDLVTNVLAGLGAGEEILFWFEAEDTSFVRFNHGRVRQAGSVRQAMLSVDLIRGSRHATGKVTLSGQAGLDRQRLNAFVGDLRMMLAELPEDPHLLYSTQPSFLDTIAGTALPDPGEMTEQVLAACAGTDFVGILAAGEIYRGFANSLGQRNWFARPSHQLGFSLYSRADKAVKGSYSGLEWDNAALHARLAAAQRQLEVVSRPSKTVKPGSYRVYLAPSAANELFSLLGGNAFGLKNHRTKQTPLLRMLEGVGLGESIDLKENTAGGVGPAFGPGGFLKPPAVELIRRGCLCGALVSPRSAREFGVPTNGAADGESPESLELAPGELAQEDVPASLGTGIYVNNLWYLNYSDRAACRITGMTRFATFWVEDGRIVAPLDVMRFDETLYNLLGANLLGLTREREMLLDDGTYGQRSTGSMVLPGALIEQVKFTL